MAIEVDRERYELYINRKLIPTTQKEFDLFCALRNARGKVLSESQILEKVWGHPEEIAKGLETPVVRVTIGRLRQRLGKHSTLIKNVYGRGFRYTGS